MNTHIQYLIHNTDKFILTGSTLCVNDPKDTDYLVCWDQIPNEHKNALEELSDIRGEYDLTVWSIKQGRYNFIMLDPSEYDAFVKATRWFIQYLESFPKSSKTDSKEFRQGFFQALRFYFRETQ